ncbi:ABC transporter ATP-binding protein [Actinopolymorpha alba]|uniref:ABC transporter ATP-binding protein n=1 Tax=Actinopolymorpha alba TaxID=533267 RepID=UPI0012F6583F|nr:ABC transporter ATP-binding protein [Actinopolymorpha alba]
MVATETAGTADQPGESGRAGRPSHPVLRARRLTRHFKVGGTFGRRTLHAVDDVDLVIGEREIVALVGESGSGKSTVARLLALLYPVTAGDIEFRGQPVASLRSRRRKLDYRRRVQMVFQDPFSSLSPVYPISHGLLRALILHRPELSRTARREEAERLLELVGLTPAREMLQKYPYELSGGQRQRVGFAAALACRPEVILADEPVSMLDVSIRIGLLNLMAELRERAGVSFLYITHDLASARYVADRMMVMYAGHVVESGPSEEVLTAPRHPYTQLLLAAAPDPWAPLGEAAEGDYGEPPKVVDPGEGCRFRPRCPLAVSACENITPRLTELGPGHSAACHVAADPALR